MSYWNTSSAPSLLLYTPHAVHPTDRKIASFGQYRHGWCYGRGVPFAEEIVNAAKWLNKVAVESGYFETDAFPGENGEIQLSIYGQQDNYLEFTIEPNGKVIYEREVKGEVTDSAEDLSLPEVERLIKSSKAKECALSDYCILITSIDERDDSQAWPFGIQLVEEYPSSPKSALKKLGFSSATTFGSSMLSLPETRQSSGGSPPMNFPHIVH